MPEAVDTSLETPPAIALPAPLAEHLGACLSRQMQDWVETVIQAEAHRRIEPLLQAEVEQARMLIRAEIEAEFDARLKQSIANGVAAAVQEILEQNRLARHRQFGSSSESGQGSLFNEVEWLAGEAQGSDEGPPEPAQPPSTSKRKPKARGHRRALPPELPRIEVVIDVPEQQRLDAAGLPMVCIGQEVSEQLDIIPMKIRVIRTIRPRYAPARGDGVPVVACLPATVIARSNFSAGFLAMLLTVKYADGLPLYRFGKVLARHGIDAPRQSLARAAIQAAQALQPIANLMRDALFDSDVLHMDETRVQVLKEPGRAATSKSWMWVQRGGPPERPVVMYDYETTRAGSVPLRLLEGYSGYLMTDDYAGYDAAVVSHGITHLACMAHARRKFVEAQRASPKGRNTHAEFALAFFARLYRIEKRVSRAPDALRLRVRQKLSRATLAQLRAWLDDMRPRVLPRSKLGEALAYTSNIWTRLLRYTERGDLPIDNNITENAIRPFVVGRKAWMFSNTPAGAHASALAYSLIETAKANGREPYAWLLYVLERLPSARDVDEIEALLPWNVPNEDLAMNLVARQQAA